MQCAVVAGAATAEQFTVITGALHSLLFTPKCKCTSKAARD